MIYAIMTASCMIDDANMLISVCVSICSCMGVCVCVALACLNVWTFTSQAGTSTWKIKQGLILRKQVCFSGSHIQMSLKIKLV